MGDYRQYYSCTCRSCGKDFTDIAFTNPATLCGTCDKRERAIKQAEKDILREMAEKRVDGIHN